MMMMMMMRRKVKLARGQLLIWLPLLTLDARLGSAWLVAAPGADQQVSRARWRHLRTAAGCGGGGGDDDSAEQTIGCVCLQPVPVSRLSGAAPFNCAH